MSSTIDVILDTIDNGLEQAQLPFRPTVELVTNCRGIGSCDLCGTITILQWADNGHHGTFFRCCDCEMGVENG